MQAEDRRVAIVTGAGSGMGQAYAESLAAIGVRVVAQDIDPAGLARTEARVREAGGICTTVSFDISSTPHIREMMSMAFTKFGRIDILVNNAGVGGGRSIEGIDSERFDRTFNVHLKGSFFCGKYAVPFMRMQSGRIVNISSRWALSGYEYASDYIAAKSAILGLTKAWAKELSSSGITVNAIAPGGVWSAMVLESLGEDGIKREEQTVPLRRWAQPEEIASTLLFLISDDASHITGQVISPNGGKTIIGF